MSAVQTTYSANIRPGLPGVIADEVPKTLISRIVEAAGGLAFGIPVIRGTADKADRTPTTGDIAAKFIGISARDRSAKAETNQYSQYELARVMTGGAIWVIVAVQVAAGDPAYFVPATSAWTNVATDNVQVAGARFDINTTGANRLAQVRLG